MLDMVLLEHTSLLAMLHKFNNVKTRKANGKLPNSNSFKALRSFTFLLNNCINNLVSIKTLLAMGFDIQARTLFRNYIESMDLAYAVLLDEDFLHGICWILKMKRKQSKSIIKLGL